MGARKSGHNPAMQAKNPGVMHTIRPGSQLVYVRTGSRKIPEEYLQEENDTHSRMKRMSDLSNIAKAY